MSRLGRNYLQVGMYTDIVFPENDVRFIAVNDNVDSAVQTEFDMTPIRNFCNELYARDTAKKIKSTFRMKGESGKHLTTNPPFGFVKDAENKDKWLIDEEAAQTVRYIFKLCYDGLGPTQIAKKLKAEKVLTPTAYKAQKDGKLLPVEPYKWAQKTVAGILEKLEYIGHTENFKTTSKNYRSKKRVWNDKENRRIFEDTHPAIVDRHIFETVQEIRKHKRRPAATGKISIFSGKVFCADCGAKLYYSVTNNYKREQAYFFCSAYRKNSEVCSVHYIREKVVEQLVLESMQRVLWYVQSYEKLFAQRQLEEFGEKQKKELAEKRRELDKAKLRVREIDGIIQKLYEDNATGKISDERFATMSMSLENEQRELKDRIPALENELENAKIKTEGLQRFIDKAKQVTRPNILTPELVHEFIEKIVVSAPEYKNGKRCQEVAIYYNGVGIVREPTAEEMEEYFQEHISKKPFLKAKTA